MSNMHGIYRSVENYRDKKSVGSTRRKKRECESPARRRSEGGVFSSQDELWRKSSTVGRWKELRAEQGERSEDEDQLRGGAVRRVPAVEGEIEKALKGHRFVILVGG